jgi:hypothetical protein
LTAKSPTDAWIAYRTKLHGQCEELFSEYVDFLGGLALRDTGLGRLPVTATAMDEIPLEPDVYHMADELIKHIFYIGGTDLWHSMAIPARREATARTLARIIRLGFPEWTVWAVPLGAFEFGRVVVSVNNLVSAYAHEHGGADPGLDIALADAFATFSMGPSYAYASVLTRLEPAPRSVPAENPGNEPGHPPSLSDQERLGVILSTLRLMDPTLDVYGAIVTDLEDMWQVAAENVKAPVDVPGEGTQVEDWTRHMWDFLREAAPLVMYKPARYEAAAAWAPLPNIAKPDKLEKWQLRPDEDDVRDILSAAWHQRIQSSAPSDRDLAEAALKLWRKDLDMRNSSGKGPVRRGGGT